MTDHSGVPSETATEVRHTEEAESVSRAICDYCQSLVTGRDFGTVYGYYHLHEGCFKEIDAAKHVAGSLPREAGAPPILLVSDNGFPRRIRRDLYTPAELAISSAVTAVEAVGADVRLTNAVIKLGDAQRDVADYIDDAIRAGRMPMPESRASVSPGGAPPTGLTGPQRFVRGICEVFDELLVALSTTKQRSRRKPKRAAPQETGNG